jgi:hypothetical protein
MSAIRKAQLHRACSLLAALTLVACSSDGSRDPLAPMRVAESSTTPSRGEAGRAAVPFKGTIVATETNAIDFETLISHTHIVGSGTATQIGRYRLVSELVIDLNTLSGVQQAVFTAANGDKLTATVIAQGTETVPGVTITTLEIGTITGGTGRFAGATGSYVMRRVLSEETGASSGEFTGTLNLAH